MEWFRNRDIKPEPQYSSFVLTNEKGAKVGSCFMIHVCSISFVFPYWASNINIVQYCFIGMLRFKLLKQRIITTFQLYGSSLTFYELIIGTGKIQNLLETYPKAPDIFPYATKSICILSRWPSFFENFKKWLSELYEISVSGLALTIPIERWAFLWVHLKLIWEIVNSKVFSPDSRRKFSVDNMYYIMNKNSSYYLIAIQLISK